MSRFGTRNEPNRIDWVGKTLAKLPSGWKVLDAGAGEKQYAKFCTHLDYVSQDFAAYDPKDAPSGLQMNDWDYGHLDLVCDIVDIPRKDGSFDAILCTEVFEHLPDPLAALREFSRLLRPGGELILTAPFGSLTHFAPHHYSTGFSRYYYEKHLTEHGFTIEELTPNGNYFEVVAQEVRRVKSISTRYLKQKPRPWERAAISVVLKMLARFGKQGNATSELGCFGWHVRAKKNDANPSSAAA